MKLLQTFTVRIERIELTERNQLRRQAEKKAILVGDREDYGVIQPFIIEALTPEHEALFQKPGQRFALALIPLPDEEERRAL